MNEYYSMVDEFGQPLVKKLGVRVEGTSETDHRQYVVWDSASLVGMQRNL